MSSHSESSNRHLSNYAMSSSNHTIRIVSKQTLKPSSPDSAPHEQHCHLAAWDVCMLCVKYLQVGLLFTDLPPSLPTDLIISRLKTSLSIALRHFYPLAGRLLTEKHRNEYGEVTSLSVLIDCNDEGVDFIHAVAEHIYPSDVLSPGEDIPSFIDSFFPSNGSFNYEGHSSPLLSVQVTELAERSFFLACCINHVVVDGTSYWKFINAWAEITRSSTLSSFPSLKRWFIEGQSPPVMLPFSDPSEFMEPFVPPVLRERFFHFSGESIAKLKARANEEVGSEEGIVISSFQAMSALMWRAITRARGFPMEQLTTFRLAIQNRERLRPALSPEYFGNSVHLVETTVTVGELLANGIGWAARKLNRTIAEYTDVQIRMTVRAYHEKPVVYKLTLFDSKSVMMGSSPRFDTYGCDFGWGKVAAARAGPAHKCDGKVSAFPGREGGGSVDLDVTLLPKSMAALIADQELLHAISQ